MDGARVLEIGSGYGRDTLFLAEHGYSVVGAETSPEGISMARNRMFGRPSRIRPTLLRGTFPDILPKTEVFDAVLAHRVVHLVPDPLVHSFCQAVADAVIRGGLALLSARAPSGFDPTQMKWVGDSTAVYTEKVLGREGHRISFWSKARFEAHFRAAFDVSFYDVEELEASANGTKRVPLILMSARRR